MQVNNIEKKFITIIPIIVILLCLMSFSSCAQANLPNSNIIQVFVNNQQATKVLNLKHGRQFMLEINTINYNNKQYSLTALEKLYQTKQPSQLIMNLDETKYDKKDKTTLTLSPIKLYHLGKNYLCLEVEDNATLSNLLNKYHNKLWISQLKLINYSN